MAELTLQHVAKTRDAIENYNFNPDMPLEAVVKQIVRNHIALHKIEPELHHILTEQIARIGGLDHQEQMFEDIRKKLLWMLQFHTETKTIKHPEIVIMMSFSTVEAVTHNTMLRQPELLDSELFEAELIRLILGFIINAERDENV